MTNARFDVAGRSRRLLCAAVTSATLLAIGASGASAQQALGVPFIGDNHLTFYSAEMNRMGSGDAMTAVFGGTYARRFRDTDAPFRVTAGLRGSARALDESEAGVIDVAGTVALTRDVWRGLSMALAGGIGTTLWGSDATNDGRIDTNVPLTLGAGYDLRVRSATITPFVAPSLVYYQTRNYVNDERVSKSDGIDGQVAAGVSIRLKEVVFTSSRIHGEHHASQGSRWVVSAGISF